MQVITLRDPYQVTALNQPETVSAIGFFDGIHKGHQKVIKTAQQIAYEESIKSAVITFSPHPSAILKGGNTNISYITPLTEKQMILEGMGIDFLYIIEFNHELAHLSPDAFINRYIKPLRIKHLVTGFDFTYGHKGAGNVESLKVHSQDAFDVTVIDKLSLKNEKVSSTRIRQLLSQGDMCSVNHLLGRPFSNRGVVVDGMKRGRDIGFPTANIRVNDNYMLPKVGVYGVKVYDQGKFYPGMANLGYNPTFNSDEDAVKLEVHLFDFDQNLYGKELIINWYTFIRSEQKFANIDQLITQLQQDEQKIRQLFSLNEE